MFADRVKYTATQTSDKIFSLSTISGYETLTEGARTALYIADASGNGAHVDGKRFGANLNVVTIHNTTESDNAMPTFGSGITVYSTVGAKSFERGEKIGGLVYGPGQSNSVGYDEVAYDSALDYTDPRIREYAYDVGYLATADEGMRIAQTPLHWPVRNPTYDAVSSATHFARQLIQHGGWGGIDIIPCAQDSTASGNWGTSDTLTLRMIQAIENWLTMSENHELACFVWQLGETDGLFSTPQATFETFMENFKANVESEVLTNIGQDITGVPWVVIGMARVWYSGVSGREGVQRALESAPGRMERSAFVFTDGLTENPGDDVHMSNAAQREIAPRLFEGYLRALGNTHATNVYGSLHSDLEDATSTSTAGVSGSINETLEDATLSGSGWVEVTGTLSETLGDATLSASGSFSNGTVSGSINETLEDAALAGTGAVEVTGTISETLEDATLSASGTFTGGSSRPNTDAISGGTAYYANEGVTTDASGNVTGWSDYFSNHDMTFPNPDSSCTDGGAAGLSFDGTTANTEGGRISGSQQNGNECSMLAKFKGTAGYLLAGLNCAIYLGTGGSGASSYVQGTNNPVDHDASGNDIDDNVTHTLAVTRDASGNIVAILDGTEIHNSTGTQAKSTENIRVGVSGFGGGFNGTVEFIYFNDTTALSSTQIANIFSEV